MKKTLLTILALVVASVPAALARENPTTELLAAKPVKHFIRIGLVQEANSGSAFSLQYGIDDFQDLDPLTDGIVFRTESGADIYVANFNPLLQKLGVQQKETPDASYASLAKFLEDVEAARKALSPAPATPGGGPSVSDPDPCKRLLARIGAVQTALNTPQLTPAQLKSIVERAVGYDGVLQAKTDLQTRKDAIDLGINAAEENLRLLGTEFSSIAGTPATADCLGGINSARTAESAKPQASQDILRRLDAQRVEVETAIPVYKKLRLEAEGEKDKDGLIAKMKKLSDSIAALIKSLDPYLVKSKWRGPVSGGVNSLTDFDLGVKVAPNFVNETGVTVTGRAQGVAIDQGVIVLKALDATEKTAVFRVRRDSLFIPERAAAAVYSRLKYPTYASQKDSVSGKTVVARTDEEDPWNGAILLNLVMRLRGESVVNPMIQIGVSTAKDYPGLLAGLGLRFTRPVALGLTIGGMVTRYKDLDDNLQVGSEVTGDADIDKHLVLKTSPVVPYIALQIKF